MTNAKLVIILVLISFFFYRDYRQIEMLKQQNQTLAHSVYTGIWGDGQWTGWTRANCDVRWFKDGELIGAHLWNVNSAWRVKCDEVATTTEVKTVKGDWEYADGVDYHPLNITNQK